VARGLAAALTLLIVPAAFLIANPAAAAAKPAHANGHHAAVHVEAGKVRGPHMNRGHARPPQAHGRGSGNSGRHLGTIRHRAHHPASHGKAHRHAAAPAAAAAHAVPRPAHAAVPSSSRSRVPATATAIEGLTARALSHPAAHTAQPRRAQRPPNHHVSANGSGESAPTPIQRVKDGLTRLATWSLFRGPVGWLLCGLAGLGLAMIITAYARGRGGAGSRPA
jgi:hypothetical protein